jgi:hypothetical protein
MIVVRDGLGMLVDRVRDYLAEQGDVTANVTIGWKEKSKQSNQGPGGANRVVFTPSDDKGEGGTIRPPATTGGVAIKDAVGKVIAHAYPLADWDRTVLVSVWAVDVDRKEDERAQYEATVALLEKTMRAVRRFSPPASGKFGRVRWERPELEREFGREAVVAMTFVHPLFDAPEELAFPDAIDLTKNPES